jgi:outer membrane lipoprotein-sorting protein
MSRRFAAVLIVSLTALSFAQTPPELPAILKNAFKSASTVKMSGTRQVEMRDGPRRVVTREFVLKDGLRTRTWFPSDSPRAGEVIVEDGKERRQYFPSRNEILVSPTGKVELMSRFRRLGGKDVRFAVSDGGQIAGRRTKLVSVTDNKGNVRQRMWMDEATGFMLKREFLDGVGSREGSFEFTEVDFSPKLRADDFQIRRAGATVISIYDQARRLASNAGLQPVVIPSNQPGFLLKSARVMKGPNGSILHQLYETENGPVSLFQGKQLNGLDRLGNRRGDRDRAPMNVVTWTTGGTSFALVGGGSKDLLNRIAQRLGKS